MLQQRASQHAAWGKCFATRQRFHHGSELEKAERISERRQRKKTVGKICTQLFRRKTQTISLKWKVKCWYWMQKNFTVFATWFPPQITTRFATWTPPASILWAAVNWPHWYLYSVSIKFNRPLLQKLFDGDYEGIPVLKYDAALYGEVKKPGLGPLHPIWRKRQRLYLIFVSSEVVKWNIKDLKVLDRASTFILWAIFVCWWQHPQSLRQNTWLLTIKLQRPLLANRSWTFTKHSYTISAATKCSHTGLPHHWRATLRAGSTCWWLRRIRWKFSR